MRCLHSLTDIKLQVFFGLYAFATVQFQKPVDCANRVASVDFEFVRPFPVFATLPTAASVVAVSGLLSSAPGEQAAPKQPQEPILRVARQKISHRIIAASYSNAQALNHIRSGAP